MKHKVEGHANLYKDLDTGVIVNRESSDRDRYRIAKQQSLQTIESSNELKRLSDEIDEIKSLLKQLINK